MLCPYCGAESANAKSCDRCRGLFEPLSRQASQNTMGPWFVRDEANPFRPGCSYQTLKILIERRRVNESSVLRGPSTRQFWMRATRTPGVAHLLGLCHACQKHATSGDTSCTHCGVSFQVSDDRQHLGLADIRLVPGQASAQQIASAIQGRASENGSREYAIELDAASSSSVARIEPSSLPEPHALAEEPKPPVHEPADNPWDRAIRTGRSRQVDEDSAPGGVHRSIVVSLLAFAGAGVLLVCITFVLGLSSALSTRGPAPIAPVTSPASTSTQGGSTAPRPSTVTSP
jgi:hypothetical protein